MADTKKSPPKKEDSYLRFVRPYIHPKSNRRWLPGEKLSAKHEFTPKQVDDLVEEGTLVEVADG